MLTPRFDLSQDEEFVYITVHIANIRFSAAAIEIVVNENVFVFSLPPYYLRLRFPKPLIETEDATSQFVPQEECIKIRIPKLNKSEFFPDLDLGAKLLARLNEPTSDSNKTKPVALIEEVDVSNAAAITEKPRQYSEMEQEAMNYDWEIPQTLPTPLTDLKTSIKYGFDNQYSDYLAPSLANGNDINELSDPDHLQADDRIMERLIKENIKFDMEYYANDYINVKYLGSEGDQGIIGALKFISPFSRIFNESPCKNDIKVEFSKEENDQMTDLPRKSYLIDDARPLYYTIMCLLYAYSYESRTFGGETTIESAWTIGFPLYRHYELVIKTWMDVYWLLRCGKRGVLKALLAIRELFRKHDIYYVYCKILLDDLCAWVLRDDGCNDVVLRNLAHALRKDLEKLKKGEIVFEKIIKDDTIQKGDETEESHENQFEFFNLDDIEELADEAYRSSV